MFTLSFLFLINLGTIWTCDSIETRKRCECKAIYGMGVQTLASDAKLLFTLPSYDDCGINLDCERERSCMAKCISQVRLTLGGRDDSLTQTGRNKICSLIATNNAQVTANSSIRVWASWKYGTGECNMGVESVVQDVCCNRRCNCSLISQRVSSSMNDNKYRTLVDFTSQIVIPEISYECSSLDTLSKCQDECLNEVGIYFDNKDIKRPDPDKLNANIFFGNENAATKVCNELNESVPKPGSDMYALWNNGIARGSLSLGRVCCQPKCSCEYVFRDAFDNKEVVSNKPVPLSQPPLSRGYECSNELSDCMSFCRRNAFNSIIVTNSTFNTLNESLPDLDVFRDSSYIFYMCDTLIRRNSSTNTGFNVFYRYTQDNVYPFREDIHIGRICCTPISGNALYLGSNRCN